MITDGTLRAWVAGGPGPPLGHGAWTVTAQASSGWLRVTASVSLKPARPPGLQVVVLAPRAGRPPWGPFRRAALTGARGMPLAVMS